MTAWIARMAPEQGVVRLCAEALTMRSPRVVAAGRDAQNPAHHVNRPDIAMLIHEPLLHRPAAPKMSAEVAGFVWTDFRSR